MKKTIRITNIVIILFTIFMFIFTAIDVKEISYKIDFSETNILGHLEKMSEEPHSIINKDSHAKVLKYLEDTIKSYGIENQSLGDADGYQIQKTSAVEVKNDTIYETYDITNVVVQIKANSNATNDAIMIMAHYDSVPMGYGASDDLVGVSVMLESIRYYREQIANGFKLSNDLIFVFTDGEEFGLYGAEKFIEEFNGFNDVVNRIKFAMNLESRGTEGTLIMFETSKLNYNTVKMFAGINENIFTSSIANMVYQSMPNGTDFSMYNDRYQGLNFANLGGGYNYHTQNDSFENASLTYLSQQAILLQNTIEKLASFDLNTLYESNQDAIFFSYLNLGTVVYSETFAIVMAVLTILLLISVVVIRVIKKRSIISTLKGLAVFVSTLIAVTVLAFGLYYLFNLLAVMFGALDSHVIGKVTYSSVIITIPLCVLAFSAAVLFVKLFSKLYRTTFQSVSLITAYCIAFLGIVLTFVLPVASYLFIFSGFFLLIIELLKEVITKFDLSKIHLNTLVFALSLPLILPVITLASDALGLTMCYVYALLAAILALYFVPSVASSLDVTLKYRAQNVEKNFSINVSVLSLIVCIVIFFITSTVKVNISTNLQGKQGLALYPYDDAVVYVMEEDRNYYMIKDLDAYLTLKESFKDFKYDSNLKAYIKEDTDANFIPNYVTTYELSNEVLNVDRLVSNGYCEISITNNVNITGVRIEAAGYIQNHQIESNSNFMLQIRSDAKITFTLSEGTKVNANINSKELVIRDERVESYCSEIAIKEIDPNTNFTLIYNYQIA